MKHHEFALLILMVLSLVSENLSAESSYRSDAMLWLPQNGSECSVIYKGKSMEAKKAVEILSSNSPDTSVSEIKLMESDILNLSSEGYVVEVDSVSNSISVKSSSGRGLLYGALSLYRRNGIKDRVESPRHGVRILNHWDNLDRTVERGYAGKSIWDWNTPLDKERRLIYERYALANAMVGINGTVVNNVNASPQMLRNDILQRVAEVGTLLRPYGIKVYLSVNFASPMTLGGLSTADPCDKEVKRWWKEKVKEIYKLIPDFGGFLVKANSEGQPGPCDFGRTHAEGANMLASCLRPYGGIVMWRAFVYSPSDPDRAKQAFNEFAPLDGKFEGNVSVQIKNGPIDFQPREPYSPLFGAMPKTLEMAELQITQEYLGHSNHLAFLAPMWKEFFQSIRHVPLYGVAGVANIGDDDNFTSHPLAQANWYSFGRLAWDPDLSAAEIAKEWMELTDWLKLDEKDTESLCEVMCSSHQNVVEYMMPMGLHHLFAWGHHYGPEPWCDIEGARPDWMPSYYHKASKDGIGFDRTIATGSGATSQYPSPLREMFEDVSSCPENYLLWFHHLSWNHRLPSGETLWETLNRHYDSGVSEVGEMCKKLRNIKGIDPEIKGEIERRMRIQYRDAIWWRDACLEYFGSVAGLTPLKPSMHTLQNMKSMHLGIDNYTCPTAEMLDMVR